jgi:hypothetical protein
MRQWAQLRMLADNISRANAVLHVAAGAELHRIDLTGRQPDRLVRHETFSENLGRAM